jgi:murein endopeptidase
MRIFVKKLVWTSVKLTLILILTACAPKQQARPRVNADPTNETANIVITHSDEIRHLKTEKNINVIEVDSKVPGKGKEKVTWVKSVVEIKNLKVQMNTGTKVIKVEGQALVRKQEQVDAELEVTLNLTGKINTETGESELKSEDSKETKILTSARWLCLNWSEKEPSQCENYAVEVFIRQGDKLYSAQFDLNTPTEKKEDDIDAPKNPDGTTKIDDDGDVIEDDPTAEAEGTGSYIMGDIPSDLIGGAQPIASNTPVPVSEGTIGAVDAAKPVEETQDSAVTKIIQDQKVKLEANTVAAKLAKSEADATAIKLTKAEADAAEAKKNEDKAKQDAAASKEKADKAKSELLAQQKLAKEAEAKAEKEKTEKAKAEAAEAKKKAEQAQREADAKAKADLEAQIKLKADLEAKLQADRKAKEIKDAKEKADAEAKAREAAKAEAEVKLKAAEAEKAEQDKIKAAAKEKVENEARLKAAEAEKAAKLKENKPADEKSKAEVKPEPIAPPAPEQKTQNSSGEAGSRNDELDQDTGGTYGNPIVSYVVNSLGKTNGGSQKSSVSLVEKVSSLKDKAPTREVNTKQGTYFGNPVMINFILDVSYQLQKKIVKDEEWISEVNDISRQRGGHLTPHLSHQNGLDADMAYLIRDKKSGYYGKDVVSGRGVIQDFLLDEQYEWFKVMNQKHEGKVYCMFVHRTIKSEMCRHARQKGEYFGENDPHNNPLTVEMLRRLQSRPSDHDNHFHLRLKCPENNKGCFQANELSKGTGCGKL